MQLMDDRPEVRDQHHLQDQISSSPRTLQLKAYQAGKDGMSAPQSGVVQAKRKYLNGGSNHMDTAWARIQEFEETSKIPPEKRLNHNEFVYGITGLTVSAIDYGTIDLKRPQQIALLYYDIRKQAENLASMAKKNLASDEKDQLQGDHKPISIAQQEAEARQNRQQKASADDAYRQDSPDPDRTYDLALLGAGASVSYYLTSMGSQLDPARTIVIGLQQPWAAQRGPGVINHPDHMITPDRSQVDYGNESLMERGAFSEAVGAAIDTRVWNQLQKEVISVKKISSKDKPYYAIICRDAKPIYARKVVSGLGIGPHNNPLDQKQREAYGDLAMDMDTFQKKAGQIPSGTKIGIVGGNAAIDSVKTCIDRGFQIVWVCGKRRPAMLPGTDNEVVEAEYEKAVKQNSFKIQKLIQDRVENGEIQKTDKNKIIIKGIEVDYYVYAQGPNTRAVSDIFDEESIRRNLVLMPDHNQHFRSDQESDRKELALLPNRSEYFERGAKLAALGLQMPIKEDDPTALEIIGGQGYRMAMDMKMGDEFRPVINSLPNNVAVNDQLTPTRAQIEAATGFIPPYVEDDVNFATDSITVIAMHIALRYPNLSPQDADMWADRIIRWRRPNADDIKQYNMLQGPIPNPHAKPRENARSFAAWFKKRLSEENEKAKS